MTRAIRYTDAEGIRRKVWLREGYGHITTITQLRKRKEMQARQAEAGLDALGRSVTPNPRLAQAIRDMPMGKWLSRFGLASKSEREEGR